MVAAADNSKHPSKPGLKMKDLVDATGVPKSTILHYLHQGLLPGPLKTSPNMAYYDPRCVDRIKYIQHMQSRHRLSLSEIKQMLDLKGKDADLSMQIALLDLVFGRPRQNQLLDEKDFRQATGLSREQLRTLLDARLLLPLSQDRFDYEDLSMGKMYARGFSRGLEVEHLTYYVRFGEKIVDHEMALRRRLTRHLPHEQDAARTMEMVKNARLTRAYIIDRLFQRRVAAMRDLKEERKTP